MVPPRWKTWEDERVVQASPSELQSCRSAIRGADVLVVGAGTYGLTTAERLASAGHRVVLIDIRRHIGGSAHSHFERETGIEVHSHGPHLFHTPNRQVWDYVNRFTAFTGHQLRVFTQHRGRVFPLPINLGTICQFFDRAMSPQEARDLIAAQSAEMEGRIPSNLEEKAISLIGRPLYEAFIRGYTAKQWQADPRSLPSSIITRLPVRFDFNNRYFSDPYEGLPADGYTALFERMIVHPNISLHLGVDYFGLKQELPQRLVTVYTGPIDRYFNYSEGLLGWRTIDFEQSVLDMEDFQGTGIMNYADEDVPWTRIVEYRHFHPERRYRTDKTVIVKEFPRSAGRGDDPYYPIGTPADKAMYERYRARAAAEENVHFGGRLATYRYLDMHQAIAMALRDSAALAETLQAAREGRTWRPLVDSSVADP
jgi:UDP-galactopyranose mutase